MELAYAEYGDENNEAVVLIHAFPFSGQLWTQVAHELAEQQFHVIVPDLRGCGRTPLGDDEPSMALLADDVWDLCRRLHVAYPVVMGVSLGGYVLMEMLRQRPEACSAIALIDTKASADTAEGAENRRRIAAQMRDSGKVELFADQMLPNLLGATTHREHPAIIDHVRTWITQANPLTIAWLQDAMAGRPASFDVLSEYSGPALVLRGSEDLVCSAQDATDMVTALPTADEVTVNNCGHLPMVEDAHATSVALVNWLSQLPKR